MSTIPTPAEAREILSRFNASHFRLEGKEHARYRIPADPAHDDDIRLAAFIDQAENDARDLTLTRHTALMAVELKLAARSENEALRAALGSIANINQGRPAMDVANDCIVIARKVLKPVNTDNDHLPHGGTPEVTGGNRTAEGVNAVAG